MSDEIVKRCDDCERMRRRHEFSGLCPRCRQIVDAKSSGEQSRKPIWIVVEMNLGRPWMVGVFESWEKMREKFGVDVSATEPDRWSITFFTGPRDTPITNYAWKGTVPRPRETTSLQVRLVEAIEFLLKNVDSYIDEKIGPGPSATRTMEKYDPIYRLIEEAKHSC